MKELVERLKEEPLKSVKFIKEWKSINSWVILKYDGKELKNKIIIEKHQQFVGRWDLDVNIIYIDDDLEGLNMEAVAIHETIEKYVSQKYDLDPYEESHEIATAKEREFIEEEKGNWRSHQLKVAYIWKKESKRSH